jgi:hypothetical protein
MMFSLEREVIEKKGRMEKVTKTRIQISFNLFRILRFLPLLLGFNLNDVIEKLM